MNLIILISTSKRVSEILLKIMHGWHLHINYCSGALRTGWTPKTHFIYLWKEKWYGFLMWYAITSQQATPIAPPKATPTCTSAYRCHACRDFRRMLPICRKSRHVSATLTNELQYTLLWMVGRRIGSAIVRSRKTKTVCVRVYFWRRFSLFLGNSRTDDHPPTEKPVEGNDNWIQKEKWEQLLLQISNSAGIAGTNVLKVCGRGFGWEMGVAWWDVMGYHTIYTHSIFLSWDIATCVGTNTALIQSCTWEHYINWLLRVPQSSLHMLAWWHRAFPKDNSERNHAYNVWEISTRYRILISITLISPK